MSVTYTGTFWSAVTRALLSLRRDKGLTTDNESTALAALSEIESGEYPINALSEKLSALLKADSPERIGQSLLGYLDFNKMGSFHCYLSMARDINAALDAINTFNSPLFEPSEEITIVKSESQVRLTVQASILPEMESFVVAFLLALFRHLAGRNFDFDGISLVHEHKFWLLEPISQARRTEQQPALSVTFPSQWLSNPSFFYSPKLQLVLVKNLQPLGESVFKQDLVDAFKQFDAPARIRSEAVGELLGMSESVFRRKLKQEQLSFSALLKSHIHERSINGLLSGEKVDVIAESLGFSDRRSFDRSFKEFTGVSPGQLRQISSRLRFQRGNQALIEVTENLPPLPETISHIVNLSDDQLTVSRLVKLIEPDPIFLAHIIGKASRALYGSVPQSLEQAIGRNLGVANVRNLAVLFAAQQFLTVQSIYPNIEKLIDAMLLSNTLFEKLFASEYENEDKALLAQLTLFGPLALLLVFHSEHLDSTVFYDLWQQSATLDDFQSVLTSQYNFCLYGASSLLLVRWGFTSTVNQTLWRLCQESDARVNLCIRVCHELAFNYLCFNAAPLQNEQLRSVLSEQQLEDAQVLLQQW